MTAYSLRAVTEGDREWLYRLHRATMETCVAETWGKWDEEYQRRRFDKEFDPPKGEIVVVAGDDVGFLNVVRATDSIYIELLEVAREYQRHGIGTSIVSDLLREAVDLNIPVNLRVLRVNRARRLYERLGFSVTGEDDTHFLMECRPNSNAPPIST